MRPQDLGVRGRPAALDPPGRPGARSPTPRRRCSTSTASRTPRAPPCCASWSPGSATRRSWPACGAYFAAHAFGNATLADLLAALGDGKRAGPGRAGRAVAARGRRSTRCAPRSTAVDADGRYTEVAVVQTAPPGHPVLRPHRIGLGLYDRRGRRSGRRAGNAVEVDAATRQVDDRADTAVPALAGRPAATAAAAQRRRPDLRQDAARPTASADRACRRCCRGWPTRWPGRCSGARRWTRRPDGERPVADLVPGADRDRRCRPETEVVVVEEVLSC